MFKSLIAMLLGSESAYQTRKTYREKRVEPQHIQDARIAAAQAKRDRRARTLSLYTARSVNGNWAHGVGNPAKHQSPVPAHHARLNPFYINRSTTV